MPARGDADRSTMFTNLLTISAKFGRMEAGAGRRVVTAALAAWYDSDSMDMYAFSREWVAAHRKDLLPLR